MLGMQLTTVTANENAWPRVRLDGDLSLCRPGPTPICGRERVSCTGFTPSNTVFFCYYLCRGAPCCSLAAII